MSRAEDAAGTIERLLALKSVPLLADLHPDELAVIAEQTSAREFRPGEAVYPGDGTPVGSIHLVLEGRVAEHRAGRLYRRHGPRRVLGGVDALALSPCSVTAVAEEATRTLAIDRGALRDVLEDNFGVLSATLQGVANTTLRLRRRLVPSAGFPDVVESGDEDPTPLHDLGARIAFLRRRTWLHQARVRTLGHLARDAQPVALADGERLWSEGQPAEDAALVVCGVVRCGTASGTQRFEAGRGTIIGLEEALATEPRWYHATARGRVSLLRIARTMVVDVLEDDPDTALELLAAIANVAARLHDRLAREGAEGR